MISHLSMHDYLSEWLEIPLGNSGETAIEYACHSAASSWWKLDFFVSKEILYLRTI